MNNLPLPKPAKLGAPGLYSLPTIKGSPGLVLTNGALPEQLHFVLEDGTEIYLPISSVALKALYDHLKARFENAS